jgi:hypothetical protein
MFGWSDAGGAQSRIGVKRNAYKILVGNPEGIAAI